ncbi:MAG: hypothetical protein GXY45_09025 [Ramlibacter sp.]|nr:hypothetical protein [Ramlibacter sp.]
MKKSGFFDPVRARRQRVLMRLLPFGLVLSGVSGMAMAQPACPSPANEVGVQFPGQSAQDLRESVSMQKQCMNGAKPRRLSKKELQELRRAVREHSRTIHINGKNRR